MKKKNKKSTKKKITNKKSGKRKKIKKKLGKKKFKSKPLKFKKNLKKIKDKKNKLKNIPKDTILKVIRLQETFKPNYNFIKIFYFGLEKSLERFFNKIDGIIEGYKILKDEERKRKKLEEVQRIENERIEKEKQKKNRKRFKN